MSNLLNNPPTPDFRVLFESAPGLYLVLTTNFTIVAVSDAYLLATMTKREEILGRDLFEVFPDNPSDPAATGVSNLRASLARVLQNRVADAMAVQKYDIRRPESEGGGFEERYWSPVNSPVFGKDNEIAYIIHRAEDVTDFIALKQKGNEQSKITEELRTRAEQMEVEIYLRAQELQEANQQLRKAREELEKRVEERTAELYQANMVLQQQIAERKRAEAHIREQAALLDKTQDAIFVQDLNGFIKFWNKGAESLYGWRATEAIGNNSKELLFKNNLQQAAVAKAVETVKNSGEWSGELSQTTKGGKEITVESRWALVSDDERIAKAILVINTDITEKKILAAQFLRAQRMESIGILAGGIAHDLNNILAPILLSLQVLRKKMVSDQGLRILATLEESASRGAEMVKQVLSFARGMEGDRVPLQPKHLLGDLSKMVRETFQKSIEIETNIAKDLWMVMGDATQLYQVLMNLCVNARDAMPKGGKLTIEATNTNIDEHYARMNIEVTPGEYVLFQVTDTGTGMTSEVASKIFEPFFTTKEVGKGTGLGLSTSLAIVKSHKGFMNVYSEVGKGTQFKTYLPVTTDLETLPIEQADSEELGGHGELILVVDDEKSIREITRITLEAYGYQVMTANDGTEGVAVYATNRENISLVIMDMMMPNLDGQETAKIMQKINPQVKIISASGFIANGKVAAGIGVKAFLSKPYTAESLLKTVKEVLTSI